MEEITTEELEATQKVFTKTDCYNMQRVCSSVRTVYNDNNLPMPSWFEPLCNKIRNIRNFKLTKE